MELYFADNGERVPYDGDAWLGEFVSIGSPARWGEVIPAGMTDEEVAAFTSGTAAARRLAAASPPRVRLRAAKEFHITVGGEVLS